MNKIKEQVLDAVRAGKVVMRPRSHFLLLGALTVVGGLLLLLALFLLSSFTVFSVRHTGLAFLPEFGVDGWFALLQSMPWILIILSLLFVWILETLVRRFSFAYKKPILISLLVVFVVVLVGGGMLSQTSLHRRAFFMARRGELPFAGGVYRQFGISKRGDVHMGVIKDRLGTGFVMQEGERVLTVLVASTTRFPRDMEFVEGDKILVFGGFASVGATNTIRAMGIRGVNEEFEEDFPNSRSFPSPLGKQRGKMMRFR